MQQSAAVQGCHKSYALNGEAVTVRHECGCDDSAALGDGVPEFIEGSEQHGAVLARDR